MANFVPQLIGTTEALSPTISGLTSAVSKLAKALNLQTSTITDFVMTEVYISETDRCRIYEVGLDKKGWLESPTAVIKKNGVALNSSVDNFVVDYIGGSIEFKGNKPTPTDVLTVTATYINEFSTVLQNLSASQTELLQKVSVFKGNFDTLNQLQTDISNPQKGDYAIVLGTDNNIYVWNDTTTSWQGVFKPTDLSNFYNKTEIDNKLALKEPTINKQGETAESDNYYYSGRKSWINLFDKVRQTLLTGFSKVNSSILATDNFIQALGKAQGQIDNLVPQTRKINNKPLSTDITLNASNVGAVPTERTVNGKALSTDITLNASDVGAYSKAETDNKFAEKLKSYLIIYVSPQGSDTLGDGTQGKPYKTITYALSTVPKVMNDFRVTINLAQGTYAENVHIGGFVGAAFNKGIVIQGGSSLADSINYKVNCVEISNVSNNVNINGIKTMSFSNGSKCTVFASNAIINNCDFTEGSCAYGVLCGYGMSGVQINNCTISNTSFAAIMSSDNSILSVRNVSGSNNATGLCAGSSGAATGGIIMKGSNISLGATTAEAKFYGGQIFA